MLFLYVSTSFLQRFLSGLLDAEVKQTKGVLLKFYLDQNADGEYRIPSKVPLIPEFRLKYCRVCLIEVVFSISLCTWSTDWP